MRERETQYHGALEITGVTLAYAVLASVFTFPLIFKLSQPFSNAIDYYQNLWNFWWVKKCLIDLHRSPFWTDYLFYPTGTSLAFQAFGMINCLVALPLQRILSLPAIYNLMFWGSSVLLGLGAYLLVHHVTANRWAAFIAGVILGNCPYHQFMYWQLQNAALQWIPFYLFFLFRAAENERWKDLAWASLFLVLTVWADTYQMFSAVLFTVAFAVFRIVVSPRDLLTRPMLARGAVLTACALLGMVAAYHAPLREGLRGATYFERPVHMGLTELFGMRQVEGGPLTFWPVPLGYVTCCLSLVGVILRDRSSAGTLARDGWRRHRRFLWALLALLFFSFVLGLHPTVMGWEIRGIPLPMAVTSKLPLLSAARSPHRFLGPFMICVSVLAGYGLSLLFGRLRTARARGALGALILGAIILEYAAIPLSARPLSVSPFYLTLRQDTRDFALVETPFHLDNGYFVFLQTVHEKRLVGGYVSRNSPGPVAFVESSHLLQLLGEPATIGGGDTERLTREEHLAFLRRTHVEYVLLHKDLVDPVGVLRIPAYSRFQKLWMALAPYSLNMKKSPFQKMGLKTLTIKPEEMSRLRAFLAQLLGPPAYEDDELVAFRVPS